MAAAISTIEPTTIFAGDNIRFNKTLTDYPATTWTLAYRILSQQGAAAISITAAASGTDFAVTVTSATTATWTAGEYWLIGYVTSGTERVQVYSSQFSIKPDPATVTNFDGRSYAERILQLIEKVIEEGVIRETVHYSYGGVAVQVQSMEDAFKARDRMKAEIAQQQSFETGVSRQVLTRFV